MEFPDPVLAQQVLDFRAHHMLRNGTLAGQMTDLFVRAGFEDVSVEEMVLVVRDPGAVDNVMGLRSWARTAQGLGRLRDEEVRRWEALYDAVVADGRLLWSVTFFITSGRKPAVQDNRN